MDKALRALSMVQTQSDELDRLRARIRSVLLEGTVGVGEIVFGTLRASIGCPVIVTFDGAACALMFDGKTVAEGASPIIAVLPSGTGELKLDRVRNNARALVTGAGVAAKPS